MPNICVWYPAAAIFIAMPVTANKHAAPVSFMSSRFCWRKGDGLLRGMLAMPLTGSAGL